MFELKTWVPGVDQEWLWAVQVFIVVLITAFANFFVKRFLARTLLKLTRTQTNWDDIVVSAMSRPRVGSRVEYCGRYYLCGHRSSDICH